LCLHNPGFPFWLENVKRLLPTAQPKIPNKRLDMTNINSMLFAGLVLAGSNVNAWAQAEGDARQGAAFAQAACSQCHAVGRNQVRSRNRNAPSFRSVARAPGMTGTALHVWFETPHPSMPNLILRSTDKENVFAYILSLKDRN
jgi:mono/diheme cytochrome c family protein